MSVEVKREGEFKLKKKTPTIKGQGNIIPEITKVDLSKPPKTEEDAVQVGETKEVADDKRAEKWLMINEPEIYKKWKKKYGSSPVSMLKSICRG
jgi:hypothetical protein